MPTNKPRCPACNNSTKKNGTTSKGTTRWRCTTCGHSFTRTTQHTAKKAATMNQFITWITGTQSLTTIAEQHHLTRQTLTQRFSWCWLITPTPHIDPHRIEDQIFLDATYLASGCLLIAATKTHILNWTWARSESTSAYTRLISPLAPPLMAVIDGGQGAQSAIHACWPTTTIQRCLVHAQRNVRRHTTSRPRTDAGKALYALALQLTSITTLDQARQWAVHLQQFHDTYRHWMNEKSTVKDPLTGAYSRQFTHPKVRSAFNSLQSLFRRQLLFNYLQPPPYALDPAQFAATTNSLEGGFNSPLKELIHRHRGLSIPHQRTMADWWLYLKTRAPDDPATVARSQRWGQDGLDRAHELLTHENTQAATNDNGAPAGYDTAIDTEYQHSMGIQKGWAGTNH